MFNFSRQNGHSESNGRSRVLVVGTTPDYVDLLQCEHPGKCLFLTDSRLRLRAKEPPPRDADEVLYRYDKLLSVFELLKRHQDRYDIKVIGIACFDCESISLASLIAKRFRLPYPCPDAIVCCRNKRSMKQKWIAGGTTSPGFSIVRRSEEAVDFLRRTGGPCVIKPLSGSGSELVFRVEGETDCRLLFGKIIAGLASRRTAPLYRSCKEGQENLLMEELVDGEEYSCDFIVSKGSVNVIRLTRKHLLKKGPLGTIEAYELSPNRPDVCRNSRLSPLLLNAATSLGINHAICMADFIVRGDRAIFLEVTPRCGGDCLPSLLTTACDFDILGLVIGFAMEEVGKTVVQVKESAVALRLFADRAGTLEWIDTSDLREDRRVLSVVMKRRLGEKIKLPPIDYDSWVLGHLIYRPDPGRSVSEQNEELKSMLQVKISEK